MKYENENKWHFRFSDSRKNNKFVAEKVKIFTAEDGCEFLVLNSLEKPVQNNAEQTCGIDPCLLHLQNLKYTLNISNFKEWKHNTYFAHGKKVGGETCSLLRDYGVVTLIPPVLNLIFHLLIFMEDLKSGTANIFEVVFVILLFYPQWKTLQFLTKFCFHKDETELQKSQDNYSTQFGHVEPFLESAFQVSC